MEEGLFRCVRMGVLSLGFVVLPGSVVQASDLFLRSLPSVEQGNQHYVQQDYQKALESYEQAETELDREPRIHFNRGNALYKLGRTKEARENEHSLRVDWPTHLHLSFDVYHCPFSHPDARGDTAGPPKREAA